MVRARARVAPGAVVLLYHRVAAPARDPWDLAVAPARFDAHMAMLRRRYRPLPLSELVESLATRRRLPARAVCVTFDDGYGDVARDGLAALERHGVHGTLFVVSGAVGAGREFWWDEVERLTLEAGPLPSALTFEADGREVVLHVPIAARAPSRAALDERGWRAWTGDPPTSRHALYHALWKALQPLPSAERALALEALRAQAGDAGVARVALLPCSARELRAFHDSPHGAIGAHTATHPELSSLPVAEQAREIGGSRRALEAAIGAPVRHFSYPFGHAYSYTADSERLVREAGFDAACLNAGGARVSADTESLRIPRLYVPNWDPPTLAWHLDQLLGG